MVTVLAHAYVSEKFRFYYLDGWMIKAKQNGIIIRNKEGFQAEFSFRGVESGNSAESIVSLASGHGTLISSGLAAVPGAEKAFAKIWKDNSKDMLELFLFRANRMLVVRAAPFTSPAMKQLETILLTLDF